MTRLRVAYAGHDFFSSCLELLAQHADVDLVLVLTDEPGGQPTDNVRAIAAAQQTPVRTGRWSTALTDEFNDISIDLLVCAAYMYRIPIEELNVRYAVNVHPTLLPEGRGPNPLAYLTFDYPQLNGVSIHEMTPELDQGPILVQEPFDRDPGDGFDEIFLKLWAYAPRALRRLLDDVDHYFANKQNQAGGSYWPEPPQAERTLDAATATVADALHLHARFGQLGFFLHTDDEHPTQVRATAASRCQHQYPPGHVTARLSRGWIVALTDGLLQTQPAFHHKPV
ncbi:formyltransferase family protein [Micromonospora echinospora]|uniref:formyltransferase family protein n=1 Tax=Micromonospora TaxID=1873 RepID=UPI000E305195|nr:formyltransferase family protein [Micromonospora sp. B006]